MTLARMQKPAPEGVTLDEAIRAWESSMGADGKAPKTIATYLYATDRLADHVGRFRSLDKITRADHEAMQAALRERLSPASVSTVYRSLRSFWKWAAEHEDMPVDRDPMNGMRPPTIPETTVQFVTDEELRAILATTRAHSRHNYRGHRDEAVIRLLAATGCRLSEIAMLTLADLDLPGASIRVMGKGSRQRWVPFDDATALALRRYLDRERPRHPSASSTDRVWLGPAGLFTANGIAQMVAQRGKAAGIERRVHPHELRHRVVSKMLRAGASEGDVMALSGHRSRSMMDRYGRADRAERATETYRRLTSSGALPRL
jgi:site-specific recombinase XerD